MYICLWPSAGMMRWGVMKKMQSVPKTTGHKPQSSQNCIKFALSNRKNSSIMLFGLVCQNVFGTDWKYVMTILYSFWIQCVVDGFVYSI